MKSLRSFAALSVILFSAFFPVLIPANSYAACVTTAQAAAIAAAAAPTPVGETATVTSLETCAGDDTSYAVPITATVTFDGHQYDTVYATTNSVITFGQPDNTYWTYPNTPSISLYSMDWLILPSYHPDEHLIINSSDGGFQVDLSARPYGQYNVQTPTNIVITAAINQDGTVAMSYVVTGPTYDGQTRTGVRLTNGQIVTLAEYGVQQVQVAPTLAPTPEPTPTPTPEPTPTPTPTPEPSVTPTPEPTPSPSPSETTTPTPEPTPSPTPEPSVTPEPTPTPTPSPSPETSGNPEPSPTPTPEVTPSPTPTPQPPVVVVDPVPPTPQPPVVVVDPVPPVVTPPVTPVEPDPVVEPDPTPEPPTPIEQPSSEETPTPQPDPVVEPEQPSDVPTDTTDTSTDTSSTDPQDTQAPSESTDTSSDQQTSNPTEESSSDTTSATDNQQQQSTESTQTNQSSEPSQPPTSPDSLPETTPLIPPATALVPHIQVDQPGVANGGIEFFGTKSQPQVVGEDGKLTPPPPPPGSGLPIPPDAITTADTFIGQPGGTTFNAPDIAVPVEVTYVCKTVTKEDGTEVHIDVDGNEHPIEQCQFLPAALDAIPGAGQAIQAMSEAFAALSNIGNDMSPITRKKAKKVLVATIVGGIVFRRRFGE